MSTDIARLVQDTADRHDLTVTTVATYVLVDPYGVLPKWTRVVITDRERCALITHTITEHGVSGSVTYCPDTEALDTELAHEARHQQLMGYEPTELADEAAAWNEHADRLDAEADQVAAKELTPIAPANWMTAFRNHQDRKVTRLRERAEASRVKVLAK